MEKSNSSREPQKPTKIESGDHHPIINDILRIALEPLLLKNKLEQILEYLFSQKELNFAGKAAVFISETETGKLAREVSIGFPEEDHLCCKEVQYGICHCGKAAHSREITYFDLTPPLHENIIESPPFAGNYAIPITKDEEVFGILAIYVTSDHKRSPGTDRILEAIASVLAVVIGSQKMDQQLLNLVNDLRNSIINLREEKKFSESVIQGLNHGLIVADLDGMIRKSNSVARNVLRPFADNLDGHYLSAILDQESANQLLSTSAATSQHTENELTLVTKTGDERIFSYSNVPREDAHGRTVGVIISLSDISELKYVRKEMEKMNRLSTVAEIASAVAHEVRNPLAGIKIMAQSIEEEASDDSEQQECSQRIIRQVDRLNELLTDFFSYARPVVPNKRPTSLDAIISEIKPLINNKLTQNHIQLTEDLDKTIPKIIADPHQVQQVFLNLFLNAIDAIKAQGTIDISATLLTKNKLTLYKKKYPALLGGEQYVIVHFTDNGFGMSPDVADQVFEPFFTTKTSGAGLGMSIVYRTLKENDGAIVIESKKGKGTTFTLFFRADL